MSEKLANASHVNIGDEYPVLYQDVDEHVRRFPVVVVEQTAKAFPPKNAAARVRGLRSTIDFAL